MMKKLLLGGLFGSAGYIWLYKYPLPEPEGAPYSLRTKMTIDHPNTHFLNKIPKNIGIIGGGFTGVITCKTLVEQGYNVEVLEKNSEVGGV